MYLSCLADNMRWDRAEGGCIPGMTAGAKAKGYDRGDDKCSHDGDLKCSGFADTKRVDGCESAGF